MVTPSILFLFSFLLVLINFYKILSFILAFSYKHLTYFGLDSFEDCGQILIECLQFVSDVFKKLDRGQGFLGERLQKRNAIFV